MPTTQQRRRLVVDADQDGLRLDTFLTAVLPDHSRSQIQRLIKDGHVQGPSTARASATVHSGQVFEVEIPAPAPATPEA